MPSIGDSLLVNLPKKNNFIKMTEFFFPKSLKITADVSLITPRNPQYGFMKGPYVGKAFHYEFEDSGIARVLESTSNPFLTALNGSGAVVGDTVSIMRAGVGMETKYSITVVPQATSLGSSQQA